MIRWVAGALLALLLVLLAPVASAQQEAVDLTEPITVVTTELEPFVERALGDRPDGFYFEIWEDIARDLGLTYEVVWADSLADMLAAVEVGDADVAVAPLAPTSEREATLDFTSAVISSGPQLGAHERTQSSVSLLATLLNSGAMRVLLVAILGLVVLGHIIWLVERRNPDMSDFHSSYIPGVFDGIWWAAVTVTTVGYGDMAPKSLRGRAVGLLAMLASLFLVGAFVSQVTADLSRARSEVAVASIEHLDGRVVGTVEGSSFETYLIDQGVAVQQFPTQEAVYQAAHDGVVDIVVGNPFSLAQLGPQYGLTGSGEVLYEEFETFGLQQGSPLREPINEALADLQASGGIQRIIDRWTTD